MATSKKDQALVKRLKKQVRLLKRKEEASRNKLRTAMRKMKKMGKAYKVKLAGKKRLIKNKVETAQSTTYAKIAAALERQLTKDIAAKGKSLSAAIAKLEKKTIAKFKKGLAKKKRKTTTKTTVTAKRKRSTKRRTSSRKKRK